MITSRFDTYVFEKGQFVPLPEPDKDQIQWSVSLEAQGYIPSERVWGEYPNTYIKVYEAGSDASASFQFAAVLKLVSFPHHVFARDLNDLIQLLNLVQPLLNQPGRPAEDTAEALYGTQGADEQPENLRG
ncbi:MAG: hypothetical protein JWL77_2191 [Chthonomonadaceae bacterium]|nr:hypothetical protein [Chthonomonadaceae bacterium]